MSLDKHPETLGDWREIAVAGMGEDSAAVKFLDQRIAKQDAGARVVKHWTQMVALLRHLHNEGA